VGGTIPIKLSICEVGEQGIPRENHSFVIQDQGQDSLLAGVVLDRQSCAQLTFWPRPLQECTGQAKKHKAAASKSLIDFSRNGVAPLNLDDIQPERDPPFGKGLC
jgi:hypothetical protein